MQGRVKPNAPPFMMLGVNLENTTSSDFRITLTGRYLAFDVVELAPPYDSADVTVNNAHRVVLELLSGMAARKRDEAGGEVGLPARR